MQLCAKWFKSSLCSRKKIQIFSFFYTKRSTILNFLPMINNSPHGACKTVQICIWLCAKRSNIYSVSYEKVHNLESIVSLIIYMKKVHIFIQLCAKRLNFLFVHEKRSKFSLFLTRKGPQFFIFKL